MREIKQDIENIKLGRNNLTKSYSVSTQFNLDEVLKLDKRIKMGDLLKVEKYQIIRSGLLLQEIKFQQQQKQ